MHEYFIAVRVTFTNLALLPSVYDLLVMLVLFGAILMPLERVFAAHPRQRKSMSATILDLIYWFMTPLLTRSITVIALSLLLPVALLLLGRSPEQLLVHGWGLVATQPIWLQAIEVLIIADFIDYWTHRALHISSFWRIHAVHHSATEMDWISSSRMHPLNDMITRSFQLLPLVLTGFAPVAIIGIVPYLAFYVIFLHSNIRWDFGPLRYVLVSPAYHRWHHASDSEALDKNFAGIFPIWDILFGSIHFPKHLPQHYGVTKDQPPNSLWAHLVYPFKNTSVEERSIM